VPALPSPRASPLHEPWWLHNSGAGAARRGEAGARRHDPDQPVHEVDPATTNPEKGRASPVVWISGRSRVMADGARRPPGWRRHPQQRGEWHGKLFPSLLTRPSSCPACSLGRRAAGPPFSSVVASSVMTRMSASYAAAAGP
jgi:hypothetical protein